MPQSEYKMIDVRHTSEDTCMNMFPYKPIPMLHTKSGHGKDPLSIAEVDEISEKSPSSENVEVRHTFQKTHSTASIQEIDVPSEVKIIKILQTPNSTFADLSKICCLPLKRAEML
ncbi:hypothetical protein JTB14_025328 [Gonioctena quinquepunctata]|nr:hypothetical protein JTB14_025328 [Gonioctena quinquepunctata]